MKLELQAPLNIETSVKEQKTKMHVAIERIQTTLKTSAITAALLSSAIASAAEPVPLSESQLDTVSAGAVSVQIKAQSSGSNGSIGSAEVVVSSTAETSGVYTLETATGTGQSYVCCNGGKSNVKIKRVGSASQTGGGSVTSTIRILNYGSYSFGIGVQIGLSGN